MRRILLGLAVLSICSSFLRSDEPSQPEVQKIASIKWRTNYAEALVAAGQQGKNVLLDFTGSDWCIWCHRLDAEVLDQPVFADFAARSLVLVQVDFPRQKPLAAEVIEQNMNLAARYSISGYPTIVLIDATGKELGRTGYIEGGPKTFVRLIKHLASSPLTGTSEK